jgi:MscS family membrane protein
MNHRNSRRSFCFKRERRTGLSMVPNRLRECFYLAACLLALLLLLATESQAQPTPPKEAPKETKAETPADTLGRETPRGTVLGFLSAARKGNSGIAVLYLNTSLRGPAAETLARQLAIVLDRRLPARLNALSIETAGSLPDQLNPDEDLVGTISTSEGNLDILLERVDRGKAGRVWLFSQGTLDSIPRVYEELNTTAVEEFLPAFLVRTRVATIPLFQWLAVFVGLPFLYWLTGVLGRLIGLAIAALRRLLGDSRLRAPGGLPAPIRLLLVAVTIRWLLSRVGFSLLARQFWSTMTLVMAILGFAWLLILVNGWAERYLFNRFADRALSGHAAVLRLTRRLIDGLVLFVGLLFTLHHFGINPTAALAGLGVGGIAVALAAQKTLENVVGGISIILDQVVHVGDTLKLGDTVGTIEQVGLRSTRIRTLDRTLVSIPNGQLASMSLETLSARDKFWFHPIISLRTETSPEQIRNIVAGVLDLLHLQPTVEKVSSRVQLLRLSSFSLDLDISAYLRARDWNEFLEIQQMLLLRIVETVRDNGAELAFPSQTLYLATDASKNRANVADVLGSSGRRSGGLADPKSA